MPDLPADIAAILTRLVDDQTPRSPAFRATAVPTIWTGNQVCGRPMVLKRSRRAAEGLFYRHLAGNGDLPAPALLHLAPALSDEGCWLLLEPVVCTPPGLSPRSPTHWWQNPARRDRAVVMLAALHARFWNQPAAVAHCPWLRRYEAEDYYGALERLAEGNPGWPVPSSSLLGQLASGADMLAAGPATLIHGDFVPDHVGWRGDTPVLLDWERVAWGSPYTDLGRLFSRFDLDDGRVVSHTPHSWRVELLSLYRATVEAVVGLDQSPETLAAYVRHAGLWELAVDLWLAARDPERGERQRYTEALTAAEAWADEP